jgi:hypothetical protein
MDRENVRTRSVTFKLDSLEWEGGVSDTFEKTPLGVLSEPLNIEQIAEVEWTIVYENFISIFQVEPGTQLKYWLKVPEKIRNKIKKYSEEIFPFESNSISDRFLLAYSVENHDDKYIGFTFESMLKESKVSLYVYTQAKIHTGGEAKVFLENYLKGIHDLNIEQILEEEQKRRSFAQLVMELFRFS